MFLIINQAFRAIPGIPHVLRKLLEHGFKIAVITNGFAEVQRNKLKACGLSDYVAEFISSEEAGAIKPDKQIFRAALRRCNVTPDQVIMVGDSWQNDIEGANALGIKTIWFNRRNERCSDESVTLTINEPSEILTILDSISSEGGNSKWGGVNV